MLSRDSIVHSCTQQEINVSYQSAQDYNLARTRPNLSKSKAEEHFFFSSRKTPYFSLSFGHATHHAGMLEAGAILHFPRDFCGDSRHQGTPEIAKGCVPLPRAACRETLLFLRSMHTPPPLNKGGDLLLVRRVFTRTHHG